MKRFFKKHKQTVYRLTDVAGLKDLMADEKCTRIEVWNDEKGQYRRFDFMGWYDKEEDEE